MTQLNRGKIIASQVIFYAPCIIEFVENVIDRNAKIAVIITQRDDSFLNSMNIRYAIAQNSDTQTRLKESLQKNNKIIFENLEYQSVINFPSIKLNLLLQIAKAPYDEIQDSEEKEARNLLEFIAGNSMEDLVRRNLLEEYIDEVKNHLIRNENKIIFWNDMAIVIAQDKICKEKFKKLWHKVQEIKYSNNLSPFEQTISEGNVNVAKFLISQGLIIKEKAEESLMIKTLFAPLRIFDFKKSGHRYEHGNEGIYEKQFSLVKLAVHKNDTQILDYLVNDINATVSIKNHIYSHEGLNFFSLLSYWPIGVLGSIIGILTGNRNFRFVTGEIFVTNACMYCFSRYYGAGVSNLHSAVMSNNTASAILILYNAIDKNITDFRALDQKSPLHIAVMNGNKDLTQLFIKSKLFDINSDDFYGYTALHYSIKNNDLGLFKLLIENGADLNKQVICKYTDAARLIIGIPYIFALTEIFQLYNFDQYSRLLVVYFGIPIYFGNIAIPAIFVLFSNFVPFASSTSSLYLQRNMSNPFSENTQESSLHLAIKYNSYEVIKNIELNHEQIYSINVYNETPLHYACALGNIEIVEFLLKKDADINAFAQCKLDLLSWMKILPAQPPFIIKTMLAFEHNFLLRFASLFLYFKTVFADPVFEEYIPEDLGTPLHYAIHHGNNRQIFEKYKITNLRQDSNFSFKTKDSKFFYLVNYFINDKLFAYNYKGVAYSRSKIYSIDNVVSQEKELAIVKLLVENGANPDIKIMEHLFAENFYLLGYASFLISSSSIPYLIKAVVIAGTILALPYETRFVKPIDYLLEKEESDTYKFLKQYTTINSYTSYSNLSWMNPYKFLYYLGLLHDDIHMKEFGTYCGGTGKDKFIVYNEFEGKEAGYKLIIKNFKISEDCLDLTNFQENNCLADLTTEEIILNTKEAIMLKNEKEEMVILIGNHNKFDGYENLLCEKY